MRTLAPLIPFTADEVYLRIPGRTAESVHLVTLSEARPQLADSALEARWERLLGLREQTLKLLEQMRQSGTIGAPLEARIAIGADSDGDGAEWLDMLRSSRGLLKELFIVSEVDILGDAEAGALKPRPMVQMSSPATASSPESARAPRQFSSAVERTAASASDAGVIMMTAGIPTSASDAAP